jgi:hypothetical protein
MANIAENSILGIGKITEGGKEYYFQTSSIYKLAAISTATGITYIAPDVFNGDEPLIQIEQLIRSGKLVRLTALVANPVDGKKNKTAQILATSALADPARLSLVGKTLQTVKNSTTKVIGKILKIRGKTRDVYR